MERLIKESIEDFDLEFKKILKRNETIERNHNLDTIEERVKNVRDSVTVNESVEGKNIIVADNISVSGTSMLHATDLLKSKGAKNVACVCLGLSGKGRLSDWDDVNKVMGAGRVMKKLSHPYNRDFEKWEERGIKAMAIRNVKGLGDKKTFRLMKKFPEIENLTYEEFKERSNVSKTKFEEIKDNLEDKGRYFDIIEKCKKENIKVITRLDSKYPDRLKSIDSPPVVFFAKGNLSLLYQDSLSIVGSRDSDSRSLKWTKELAEELSHEKVIISGGAKGIDTAAHEGALEGSGKTICVLGSGIKNIYPEENNELIKKILDQGLVISTLPPEKNVMKYSLLERNRINSGLGDGMLIVTSGNSGGTMSQYKDALRQGKTIICPSPSLNLTPTEGIEKMINEGDAT